MCPTALLPRDLEPPPRASLTPERERAIRQLLESIVQDSQEAEQRNRRPARWKRPSVQFRRVGLAAVTAVAFVAASLVVTHELLPNAGVAEAATPDLIGHETATGEPASDTLLDLAQRVGTIPETPEGDVAIRTERWSLVVTPDEPGDGAAEGPAEGAAATGADASPPGPAVTTAIIPTLRELTRHEDGTVSVRDVGGRPLFPDHTYERAWNDAGRPGPTGEVLRDETLTAGTWPDVYPGDLPADPAALRTALALPRPAASNDAAELLRAVHDLRLERLPGSALSAGVLQMLAADPDVMSLGTTVDRAGREALAIAADGDESGWPVREILLLDPDDGRPLAYEQVLMADVEVIDVGAPAVIEYTIFR
ncbi:hypothetical protein G1H11_22545 [Phytoactinopolyspora alkaliphila]|uniref:CU044_5270 family protein n=1 Tax=Phytoactinopolyspora alkaliphila TaxID=1783498 RepID=A0A6N9YSX8_9ACTN|nr:hypothetical protein [Phytoactinopolyspora alkaliphila]NED98082.1 hypothetical protein [Phytoactinopolyspora alkaliphila]